MWYLDPGPRISQSPDPRPTSLRRGGYSQALPAGWPSQQAPPQRDGKGAPGDQDSVVDLLHGPGGAGTRPIAAPASRPWPPYATTTTRASGHPCPAAANRPGSHDRRSTRPAARHAPPARERLPGGARSHHPRWNRLRDRSPRPDGDASRRACLPRPLPPIPRRRKASRSELDWRPPTCPVGGFSRSGAGSQPRLNLPVPLAARPPAITGGSVPRQPDNLCSQRQQIIGRYGLATVRPTGSLTLRDSRSRAKSAAVDHGPTCRQIGL